MADKKLNARIVHKHDVEANWLKAANFTPMAGEIIVYDIDENYDYERIKIGDGVTLVSELPFNSAQNIHQVDLSDGIINVWEYAAGVYIFTASATNAFKIYVKTGDEESKVVGVINNSTYSKNLLAVINVSESDNYKEYAMQYMNDNTAGISVCKNYYNSSGWAYEKSTVPHVVSTTHTYKENMFLCNSGSANSAYWSELPAADSELSDTSENAVQNKVVNAAISNMKTLVGDESVSSQIETAIAGKSDVGHTHTPAEVGADESGAASTALTNAKAYTDEQIVAMVGNESVEAQISNAIANVTSAIVAITDEEIDAICNTSLELDDMLTDETTGATYKLYVSDGSLKMTEVTAS